MPKPQDAVDEVAELRRKLAAMVIEMERKDGEILGLKYCIEVMRPVKGNA